MAKAKNTSTGINYKVLFIVGLAVIFLLGYKIYNDNTLTYVECLKLGSNERTELCLQELERRKPQVEHKTLTDLSTVELIDQDMIGNSYGQNNPRYTATLRNNGTEAIRNIVFQFKFYDFESATTCNSPSKDTVYVTEPEFILSGDSKKIDALVQTNFDTSGRFTWCASVFSAEVF